MGSVIDGEDVVQDTLVRALAALEEIEERGQVMPPLRPWLFRIAHNRALDLLRGRAIRKTEPIDAAFDVADEANPDPVEMLMRQEAVKTAVARYAALFNQRDWDGLRALLADDVKLHQSTYPLRAGSADVGRFFTIYAKFDGVWMAPAWVEGREVIAVFGDRADPKPSYMMWLEWRDGRISFIRDYRYARYILADAELALAPDARPAGDVH